ncbi:MAG: hypothetical protein US04_C0001G0421 [Candidatus Nomurabacteria bacterium GW2011_GWD2_36_14]|nr:MAG: hypothetical protein UR97_C0002G0051 [Candidatus Nomurabacteria bacterium GW2011_GWE2_36_115]KKP94456.1 MAG: hypothetical protein US00_C0001G0050 [Candidatus Nomurabacteria bacterium GW2011_GWF2_36_126]KKP96918.1 MAG: hypothetical protein US04_C0001G0421 [Candidatus Nomurabacteria bacterium GW2011_GWD2_36_14]KKP99478.1 MAG: hypothetical protein US08_C0001G0160 [Candidatus Nomurabacteria bacterium GW2011_GWF2_36_19]KKQ05666.1 MAG: hypothetical protein US17_C0002G0050 [Candidatus Nomuraba
MSLIFIPFLVSAENSVVLPEAGVTPQSSFYFFDKLGEALQRLFTFSPESKAKLEISFAKERIAEIKVILEKNGVNAKGLSVAEEQLGKNLANATSIVTDQKKEGKDSSALSKEISDELDPAHKELKSVFKSEKDAIEAQIEALKVKLSEARLALDTTLVESLTKEISDLKAQEELLGKYEDDNDDNIEEENDNLDEVLGLEKSASEKIREAEEAKAEFLKEVEAGNITIPDGVVKSFDALLSQAKTAFDAGKYVEAKNLAKEAKKSLKKLIKNLEDFSNTLEDKEDLNDEKKMLQSELENKLKDADKEEAKQIKEEMKQKIEELNKEQEDLKEEQNQIKEHLRGVEDNEDENNNEGDN